MIYAKRRGGRRIIVATYPDGRRFVIHRIRDAKLQALWKWDEGKQCVLLADAIASAEAAGATITRESA
jgi:hypothetical protein